MDGIHSFMRPWYIDAVYRYTLYFFWMIFFRNLPTMAQFNNT